jgi:hypothetical protein
MQRWPLRDVGLGRRARARQLSAPRNALSVTNDGGDGPQVPGTGYRRSQPFPSPSDCDAREASLACGARGGGRDASTLPRGDRPSQPCHVRRCRGLVRLRGFSPALLLRRHLRRARDRCNAFACGSPAVAEHPWGAIDRHGTPDLPIPVPPGARTSASRHRPTAKPADTCLTRIQLAGCRAGQARRRCHRHLAVLLERGTESRFAPPFAPTPHLRFRRWVRVRTPPARDGRGTRQP